MPLDEILPTLRPETWEEAKELGRSLAGWVFRGHADASWELKTTIERQAYRYGVAHVFVQDREREIIRRFRERAHQYVGNPPKEDDWLSWVSIMQHHGAPTRLLDCTSSYYIAAFFAVVVDSSTWEPNAAIWAFDPIGLNEAALGQELSEFKRSAVNKTWHDGFNKLMEMNALISGVGAVEPVWTTERLAAQHGCFLFPGDVGTPFEVNLHANLVKYRETKGASFGVNAPQAWGCCKIILPPNVFRPVLLDLYSMNISSTTLFPGLDGFSRSLGYFLEPTLSI